MANKGVYLLSTALYPAGMIKVSARGKITPYRAKGGARGVGINHKRNTSGHNPSGAGYQASGGTIILKRGRGIQPKRQGQGSPQKNLGTKSAKPFPLPKCFGFQKIFRKNFGKMKRGFVSKGRIFWVCGKNLSGVILLECYYWSDLLGK